MHNALSQNVTFAAILEKAIKLKKKRFLAQFSTKLNEIFINIWEYVDTKSTLVTPTSFPYKCFPLSRKIHKKIIKFKLEISLMHKFSFSFMKLRLFLNKHSNFKYFQFIISDKNIYSSLFHKGYTLGPYLCGTQNSGA